MVTLKDSFIPFTWGFGSSLIHVSFSIGIVVLSSFYYQISESFFITLCRHKVRRIIAVTSWCTQPGPNNPWFIEWFLKPFIIGANLRDMAIMEEFLQDTVPDEINFTIVKPPGLSLGWYRTCKTCYLL